MPSPFPGMDPFIEGQRWLGFHDELTLGIRAALVPLVRPRYLVEVQERIYLEHVPGDRSHFVRPDVSVERREQKPPAPVGAAAMATAVAIDPVTLPVLMPERAREVFLTIHDHETMQVVTVIEVLSPTNKRPGSDGRREYLSKREAVLLSAAHLVELDLLRGGERLPTLKPLPPGDYYAFVLRADRRPLADIYAWPLPRSLPPIPIPLAPRDPDVWLDLQGVFTAAYDRGGYDYSLDYQAPLEPRPSKDDLAWVRQVLQEGREG